MVETRSTSELVIDSGSEAPVVPSKLVETWNQYVENGENVRGENNFSITAACRLR